MTFGKKLREARKIKGITQRQLADKVGAKHNSVSDWENDKNKPDPDTIELICGVLDITPNYLLKSRSEDYTPSEKLLIKKYRALDKNGKDTVDTVLELQFDRCSADFKKDAYKKDRHLENAERAAREYVEELNRTKEKA